MTKEHNQEAKKEFFAAANSGKGFVSFYSQVFEGKEIERRYLIKGGPGTGKSTFMRKLAQRAEENGFCVEYYRCSSDPSSLDAIIIEGRVAVLDATSPHCVEAELVGARDEIINLGAFWDSEALGRRLDDIRQLSKRKKESYAKAYRFLDAAMQVDEASRELIYPYVNKERLRKVAKRLLSKIPDGIEFDMKVRICDSMGMSGRIRLDTYEKNANTVYMVKDCYKSGSLLLAMLADEAVRKGNKISVSYYPINTAYPDALLFEESGVAFVLWDGKSEPREDAIYINMKRFVQLAGDKKQIKCEYKSNCRLFDGLVVSAQNALETAGEFHFGLEQLYKKHMDFDAQDCFLNDFCDKLIKSIKMKTY